MQGCSNPSGLAFGRSSRRVFLSLVVFISSTMAGGLSVAQASDADEASQPVRVIKAQPLVFKAPPEKSVTSLAGEEKPDARAIAAPATAVAGKPAPAPIGHGPAVTAGREARVLHASPRSVRTDTAGDRRHAGAQRLGISSLYGSDHDTGVADAAEYEAAAPADTSLFSGADAFDARRDKTSEVIVHRYDVPTRTSARQADPHAYRAGGYSRHGLKPTEFTNRGSNPVIIIREPRHVYHPHHGHSRHDRYCQHHRRFCPSSCGHFPSHNRVGSGFGHIGSHSSFGITFGTGIHKSHFHHGVHTAWRPRHHRAHHVGHHHGRYRAAAHCPPIYRRPVSGTRIGISIGVTR